MRNLITSYIYNEEGMSEIVGAIIVLGISLVFIGIFASYANKSINKSSDAESGIAADMERELTP